MYLLWVNLVLGSVFFLLCFIAHSSTLTYLAKSKIDIKPRIQLSHKVMARVKEQACNLETVLLNDWGWGEGYQLV